ncbi:hypothetical protein LX59_00852 [Azomonas agilis]|uniref:Tat pathway signal protein n=1 Tax=Azomonas agilis TaxID=116849 RepID=A0A562J0Y5_9GAMM|nr:PhoX family phosphatase [Azomonas agilis]TWH76807.1 hypothetical protein LX59_00852 [Azomonas agilis]
MNHDKMTAINAQHREPPANSSNNLHLNDVLAQSRRQLIKGSAALCALSFMGVSLIPKARAESAETETTPSPITRLPFEAIPISRADSIQLPEGFSGEAFIPWGTPITGRYPSFLEDASNTAQDQAEQTGMHHDGMHFFPIDAQVGAGKRSDHGLLVVNHEYIDPQLLHPNGPTLSTVGERTNADEVRKEINAHGVSVVEIQRDSRGRWSVLPSTRNRRITGVTPMRIEGPARGHALMQTRYSPSGTTSRGTLNNCASGHTPWGTYLTCEENWAGYFSNQDAEPPREHSRYGIQKTTRYGWETLTGDEFQRFDASQQADSPLKDYRNEPNTFGWVVEIDPFNPDATPIKHTALGRFAHEGIIFAPTEPGQRLVCYSGDDSANEYIYKYVSRNPYRPRSDNSRLLDEGILYVARFNADGTGDWLALDLRDPDFQKACTAKGVQFSDQGEVLINTRLAADVAGATKMDRPEWGAINPISGEVYFTLTNNSARKTADAANPRSPNPYGHIIRWQESSPDYSGTHFNWSIYLLAGPEQEGQIQEQFLQAENILASPDGLWFDPAGRLWIQTDMSGDQLSSGPFGNNQMLVSDPTTGETKRFLVAPIGAEVTGITATPDFRTLFINIQHPGEGSTSKRFTSHWPSGEDKRPRSATLVINRTNNRPLI